MADRGAPITTPTRTARRNLHQVANNRTTVIVTRGSGDGGGLGDTPTGPFPETASPTDPQPGLNARLAGSPAARELTVHPAQGVVPQQFGGPLRVGGYPIYYRFFAPYHFLDLAIGEGPYDSIGSILFGGHITAGSVGAAVEIHLGTPGDTTSTLINAIEGAYSVPEGIAHVALRFKNPTTATGPWNPFDFTCQATRGDYNDPITGYAGSSGTPIVAAFMALASRMDSGTELNTDDYNSARDWCTEDIGGGIARWEFALRVDQEDTLENHVKNILSYCKGYLRYNYGKHSVYMEAPRALALDGDGNVFHFVDYEGLTDVVPQHVNVSDLITYTRKGALEVPTFCTVDYTDVQTVSGVLTFITSSVQVPSEADLDPALDRIELRLSLLGIMSIERARRRATLEFNVAQLDKDVTIPSWFGAMQTLPGDRVRVGSLALIASDATCPNADAVPGFEELVITDVKLGDSPVQRARPYRDATYGDVIDTSGPPEPPPPPPDGDALPNCPTDLAAPNADVSQYGQVEFTPPDDDSIISYYDVRDIYTSDISVGFVYKTDPIGGDGKYHASFPALVHTDPDDGDVHLAVRVDSVSYAGNVSDPCSSTSWDVTGGGGGGSGETSIESAAYWIGSDGDQAISSSSYDPTNYATVLAGTKRYSTILVDPDNDFFYTPGAGNVGGIIVPKLDGQFHITATVGWSPNEDSGFRALAFFHLNALGGIHHDYITIDDGGADYLTGDVLLVTGGTLATGGFWFAGSVIASGGVITGIVYDQGFGGIGWTSAPAIDVASADGIGAVLTAHLAAPFTVADLNWDCSGGEGSPIRGTIQAEDILPAVNSADCPTRQALPLTMSMRVGDGLLIGVQQGSGGSLDLLSDIGAQPATSEGCQLSIFHLPPQLPTADDYGVCGGG